VFSEMKLWFVKRVFLSSELCNYLEIRQLKPFVSLCRVKFLLSGSFLVRSRIIYLFIYHNNHVQSIFYSLVFGLNDLGD